MRWFDELALTKKKLNGILYFHRIINPRIISTARANLQMFKWLYGSDNLDIIILVMTFWNDIN